MPSAKYSSSGRPRFSERKHHQHAPAWSIAPLDTPTGQRRHHRHHRHDRGCEDEQTGAHASAAADVPRSSSQRFRELGRRGEATAGTGARAFLTATSMAAGASGRSRRKDGAEVASRFAMTACGVGPVNGGSPASISYRTQPSAKTSLLGGHSRSLRSPAPGSCRAGVPNGEAGSPSAVHRRRRRARAPRRSRRRPRAPREKKDVLRLDVPVHDALSVRGIPERLRYLAMMREGFPHRIVAPRAS